MTLLRRDGARFSGLIAVIVVLGALPAYSQEGAQGSRRIEADSTGSLGFIPTGLESEARVSEESTRDYTLPEAAMEALNAVGNELWRPRRWSEDERGTRHYRMKQYINGLEVVGAEIVLHAEPGGQIKAVDAQFLPSWGLPTVPTIRPESALPAAILHYGRDLSLVGSPRLSYLRTTAGAGHLVWRVSVSYTDEEKGPQRDNVFVDAVTGSVVESHPEIHSALSRRIYTAGNGTNLPGTLLITEGGSSGDAAAQEAYSFAGNTYDYFWNTHSRDSWNASGAQMKATVHFGTNHNNASWDGGLDLTYFGDGDGVNFGPFHELDVLGHEFTHGVIESEANLTYQNESGAINESLADIFGAMIERSVYGLSANTWLLGEDVSLGVYPFRSMSDPYSIPASPAYSDYYPDRHVLSQGQQPNAQNDWGWVHYNSGISNLAFYLLSQGGTHPQGKTTNSVTGIGHAKAELIFYRTLRDSLLSGDGFKPIANKTQSFSKGHYGAMSQELKSTCAAWEAVGVPDNRLDCPDPNATLLPPADISRSPPGDICYGVQDVWWTPVSGATQYQLRISADSSDYTGAGISYSGSATSTVVNAGYGTSQSYARVSACDANGCSALSTDVVTIKATTTCP